MVDSFPQKVITAFKFFAEPEATIEKFEHKLLPDLRNVIFDLNEQAEDVYKAKIGITYFYELES